MAEFDLERDVKENLKKFESFSSLVDKIEDLSDEKKHLYKEIYENANTDRQHAYGMYRILIDICGNNTTEHAVHARSIGTFVEKMSRANDQLLKLCDLIRRAEEKNEFIDPDDMFNAIQNR